MFGFLSFFTQLLVIVLANNPSHVQATSTALFYLKASQGTSAGKFVHVRLDSKSNAQKSFPILTSSVGKAAQFYINTQGFLIPYSSNSSLAPYTAVEYFTNDAQTGYQLIYFQPNYPASPTSPAILCQNINGTVGQTKDISCNFADAQPIDGPARWGSHGPGEISLFQQGNTGNVQDLGFYAVIAGSFTTS